MIKTCGIVRFKSWRVQNAFLGVHGGDEVISSLGALNGYGAFLCEVEKSVAETWNLVSLLHLDLIATELNYLIRGQLEINSDSLVLLAQKVCLHMHSERN